MTNNSNLSSFRNATAGSNQQKVIDAATSNGRLIQHMDMIALFSMPDSVKAIDEAISVVGLPPVSTQNGADWQTTGIINFWALVKYLKKYPLPTTTTSCKDLKTALTALDGEIAEIHKLESEQNADSTQAFINAVNTIKLNYNTYYKSKNCDNPTGTTTKPTKTGVADAATPSKTIYYIGGGVLLLGLTAFIIYKIKHK